MTVKIYLFQLKHGLYWYHRDYRYKIIILKRINEIDRIAQWNWIVSLYILYK